MYSVCTVQLYNVYKQTSAGRRVRPRRARLDKIEQNVQARFLYFCGLYGVGVIFHFFEYTPGQNLIEYLYLTLNQPPTAPLSHFPNPKQTLYLSHFSPIIPFLSIIISLH